MMRVTVTQFYFIGKSVFKNFTMRKSNTIFSELQKTTISYFSPPQRNP